MSNPHGPDDRAVSRTDASRVEGDLSRRATLHQALDKGFRQKARPYPTAIASTTKAAKRQMIDPVQRKCLPHLSSTYVVSMTAVPTIARLA